MINYSYQPPLIKGYVVFLNLNSFWLSIKIWVQWTLYSMKELKYFKLLPKLLTSLSNKNVERVSDLTLTPHHPIRQSQHIWLSKAGSFLNNREFPEKNPSQWFASFF